MGRWIERLHRNSGASPCDPTAKADESSLLAASSVPLEGGARGIAPDAKAVERRRRVVLARLLRWGWDAEEAEATAARIAGRDVDDDRRTCFECCRYAPGRCATHRAALLPAAEVGRDLAGLLQRCPGYAAFPDSSGKAPGRAAMHPNGVGQHQTKGTPR